MDHHRANGIMNYPHPNRPNSVHRNTNMPPSTNVPPQMSMSSQGPGMPVMHQPHPHPFTYAQHPQGPPPPHQQSPMSPNNTRKRRLSDDGGLGVGVGYPTPGHANLYDDGLGQHASDEQLPPPQPPPSNPAPPKRNRVNTPWTPSEEQKLKVMRDAGNSWNEIAKSFPNRTEGSVKKHWYKDMHYAEFAEDESAALLAAIKEYEASKWKVIGQKVGKPAKACEQYAKENFSKEQLAGKI